jgi:hypothetical protein
MVPRMDDPQIDWQTAHVDTDVTLTVSVTGDVDDVWMDSFDTVLGYLSEETRGGVWGDVAAAPQTIRVRKVGPGSTSALKDFLEAAVREANSLSAKERVDQ